MKRYRLRAKAQIDGTVRDPGYEFDRPDDWIGPHRTEMLSPDLHASSIDAVMDGRFTGPTAPRCVDIPLYEEIVAPSQNVMLLMPPDITAPVTSDPDDPRLQEMLALVDKLGDRDV
jgi:hypothetical protein